MDKTPTIPDTDYYKIDSEGLNQEARDKLDEVISLLSSSPDSWTTKTNLENLKVYTKSIEGSPDLSTRADFFIEGVPADNCVNLLKDLKGRGVFQLSYKDFQTFEEWSDKIHHVYQYIKTPFGITDRDFVLRRVAVENYKGVRCIYLDFSVEHPDFPETKKIRADAKFLAALIYEQEGGTLVKTLNQVDMKVRGFFNFFLGEYSEVGV